jgi:hypothetical protein
MADRARRKRQEDAPSPLPAARARDSDEAERALGRAVALWLPVAAALGAIVVGFVASVSSAILVLAAGALLGAIALLWASVRTLTGDAPLSAQLEALAATRRGVDDLAERKGRVLRALKDLEADHAVGKIDDDDFAAVTAQYRAEAKDVMRQMDLEVAPLRAEAERIAQRYLEKQGVRTGDGVVDQVAAESEAPVEAEAPAKTDRIECGKCGKANDADAAFCKHCGAGMAVAGSEKADAAS